jgi:hypothetical protein
VITAALALSLAPVSGAGAATADKTEVTTDVRTAPPMFRGGSAWIAVVWEADKRIDDFTMTVAAPAGFTVRYPSDRPASSLYGSSSLAKHVTDFAAFNLTVPFEASSSVDLRVVATWTRANHKTGRVETTLTVPLTTYAGPDLRATTASVTTSRSTPGWVTLRFDGLAPRLDDVRVTVQGPAELVVTYPGDATAAGLNGGTTLWAGTTDHAGVRLDASKLPAGTHQLDVTVDHGGPTAGRWNGKVDLVVS